MPRFCSIIICSLALAACDGGKPAFRSTDITGVDYGRTLELADHTGKLRKLEDFRGKAVVLFFGFTQCPDVCPTTLAEIAGVLKQLGPDAERVRAALITVDPARDSAAAMAEYVARFPGGIVGLTGHEETLRSAALPRGNNRSRSARDRPAREPTAIRSIRRGVMG